MAAAVFVGSDLQRLVAVEFQAGGSPEFRQLADPPMVVEENLGAALSLNFISWCLSPHWLQARNRHIILPVP
jgi:hypothetical protein